MEILKFNTSPKVLVDKSRSKSTLGIIKEDKKIIEDFAINEVDEIY
jgi:hypothetical protein